MNSVRIAGTKAQLEEAAAFFESEHQARVLVLDRYEPNHPEIASSLHDLGLYVFVPDPNGIPLANTPRATAHQAYRALNIFGNPDRRASALRTLNLGVLSFANRTASALHNYRAVLRALMAYRDRRGRWPTRVLEAGFGDDPTGHRLACGARGIEFYGVTTNPRPTVLQTEGCQRLADFFVPDLPRPKGETWYETRLEDFQTDLRFDLICSFCVYEHTDTPEEFTATTARLLTQEGVLVHQITNRAHGYSGEDHSLLDLTDEEFEKLKATGFSVRHRMLLEDYDAMFDRAGFSMEVENAIRSEVPDELIQRYAPRDPRWRSSFVVCERKS